MRLNCQLLMTKKGSDSNKINVIRTPGDETKDFLQVFKLRRIQLIVFRHRKRIINKLSKRKMFFIAKVTLTTIHNSAKYWFLKLKTYSRHTV